MVPSKWDTKGIAMLREACFKAGIVSRYDVGVPGRDQLRVMTEAQAAALHCVADVGLASMKNGQQFLVCDAGGSTVDIAVHKVITFNFRELRVVAHPIRLLEIELQMTSQKFPSKLGGNAVASSWTLDSRRLSR
jgi:hypothetical protein